MSARTPAPRIVKPCPRCHANLVLRWNGRRPFLGCANYPACPYTEPLPTDIALRYNKAQLPLPLFEETKEQTDATCGSGCHPA